MSKKGGDDTGWNSQAFDELVPTWEQSSTLQEKCVVSRLTPFVITLSSSWSTQRDRDMNGAGRETIDLPNDFHWTMKTRCRHRMECVSVVAFWTSTVVSAFHASKSNLCLSSSLPYCSIVLLACNKIRRTVSLFSFAPWNERKRQFRCCAGGAWKNILFDW